MFKTKLIVKSVPNVRSKLLVVIIQGKRLKGTLEKHKLKNLEA